jgi:hypothetical protein
MDNRLEEDRSGDRLRCEHCTSPRPGEMLEPCDRSDRLPSNLAYG